MPHAPPFFVERALSMQHMWHASLPLDDSIQQNYHLETKHGHAMLGLPTPLQLIHGDQNAAGWVEVLAQVLRQLNRARS